MRRLPALAVILDGGTRTEAVRVDEVQEIPARGARPQLFSQAGPARRCGLRWLGRLAGGGAVTHAGGPGRGLAGGVPQAGTDAAAAGICRRVFGRAGTASPSMT